MPFPPETKAALEAMLDPRHVKTRKQDNIQLSYIEGWHAIAEANRIFGFDGWCRETIELRCVWEGTRRTQRGDRPSCSYIAKVRIAVQPPGMGLPVVREGTGAGHGFGVTMGEAHESAIKEAETDATKRALSTFGNPFGLALYDKTQANVGVAPPEKVAAVLGGAAEVNDGVDREDFHLPYPENGEQGRPTVAKIREWCGTIAKLIATAAHPEQIDQIVWDNRDGFHRLEQDKPEWARNAEVVGDVPLGLWDRAEARRAALSAGENAMREPAPSVAAA